MKRYALLALALVLGCCMLTGCGRKDSDKGNMSTPPTESARPTTEPTTEHAAMEPTTTATTEPDTMPGTEEPTDGVTEPDARGMLRDPLIK